MVKQKAGPPGLGSRLAGIQKHGFVWAMSQGHLSPHRESHGLHNQPPSSPFSASWSCRSLRRDSRQERTEGTTERTQQGAIWRNKPAPLPPTPADLTGTRQEPGLGPLGASDWLRGSSRLLCLRPHWARGAASGTSKRVLLALRLSFAGGSPESARRERGTREPRGT